jgi:hypothetical protein
MALTVGDRPIRPLTADDVECFTKPGQDGYALRSTHGIGECLSPLAVTVEPLEIGELFAGLRRP